MGGEKEKWGKRARRESRRKERGEVWERSEEEERDKSETEWGRNERKSDEWEKSKKRMRRSGI